MIAETSRTAYQEIVKNLRARQYWIYREISYCGPVSVFELAARLGTYSNRISGRFTELAALGLITDKDLSGLKMRKRIDGSIHKLWRATASKEYEKLLAAQDQGQMELLI